VRHVALASCRNDKYHELVLQQDTLWYKISLAFDESGRGYMCMRGEAYEFHCIEFLDMALEVQPLAQPAKLFGYVLSIARFRSVQD
jgi:hypothetical protein